MEARRLTKMALLTALLCISAYISFPLPFSPAMVTALTLVATLTGLLLQPKGCFYSICRVCSARSRWSTCIRWRYSWSW